MNWKRLIWKTAIVVVWVTLAHAKGVSAQNSPPPVSDQDILIPCEKAVDEVRVSRVKIAGQERQLVLFEQLTANLKEQSAFWKEAAGLRKDADTLTVRIEQNFREQVAGLKDEIFRLRTENDMLRRSRDRRTFLAFGAGVALGGVVKPRF